jgi:hypothetical protein
VRALVARLAGQLDPGHGLPAGLDAALARLEASTWPEVVDRWSGLTPSGAPIELTLAPAGLPIRWAVEVAGPELAEARRLDRAAGLLAAQGAAVDPRLLDALRATQAPAHLRFGAWLAGREGGGRGGLSKLYAELPAGADIAALGLPGEMVTCCRRLPVGTAALMLGVEPARGRHELYLRPPAGDVLDLLAFLHVTGHEWALMALEAGLVDGLARLAGRTLGLSIALAPGVPPELALFVPARMLFPTRPEMLTDLVPALAGLDLRGWRPSGVTLGLDPSGRHVPAAVGLCPSNAKRWPGSVP